MRDILQLIEILQRVPEQIHKVKKVFFSDKTVWWRVDLGIYNIYSYCINILFRNYDGAGILIFKEKFWYNSNIYHVLFFQQLCMSRLDFSHCHNILHTYKTYIGFFFYMSYRYSCAVNN